ncbi:hypothetical protein [Streptomyces sp. NPDC005303]|uniref:hypothetical protein n=1 Tax=Streptomyces sp. NPDC005303 TaxID=3155713 RepID=UPI0033AB934C
MARRAGRDGGAVRSAYLVVFALCAVLAVLVHHEVSAAGVSPISGMSHGAMSATPALSATGGSSARDLGAGACTGAGMEHCSAAGVSSVHLVAQDRSGIPSPASPAQLSPTPSGHAPGAVVSRAPPDLSVLSRLRI